MTLRDASRRALYIEPNSAVPGRDGSILLVGAPTFRWQGDREETGAIFGVILPRHGAARTVPWPLPAPVNVADMRAALLPDGSWGVVFAELAPGEIIPRRPPLRDLWFARFDGQAWHDLEQLPVPAESQAPQDPLLLTDQLSPLVSHGDELAIAVPVAFQDVPHGALVFVRAAGRWTASAIPVNGIAYVQVASGADSMWRALVIRSDSAGSNVPYLYERRHANDGYVWRAVGAAARNDHAEAHQPAFLSAGDALAMSWVWVPSGAASHIRPVVSPGGPRTMLQSIVRGARQSEAKVEQHGSTVTDTVITTDIIAYDAAIRPSGLITYGVERDPGPTTPLGSIEIIQVRGHAVARLGTVRAPYTGAFTLSALSDNELVLAGPSVSGAGTPQVRVVTEVIRLRTRCVHSSR